MIRCPSCNATYLEGTLFCEECGATLHKDLLAGERQTDPLRGRQVAHERPDEVERGKKVVSPGTPFGAVELAPGSFALWIANSGRRQIFELGREILIGRADTANQVFPDLDLTSDGGIEGGVSRRHACITFRDGVPYVEDLNSTNHSYLNNVRLEPLMPRALHHGDELRLGMILLRIELPLAASEE